MLKALRPMTRVTLFVTLLLAVAVAWLYIGPRDGEAPATAMADRPVVTLQSGAAGLYPADTVTAIQAALAAGVTRLQLDVALSRDGVPVLYPGLRLDPAHTRGPDGVGLTTPLPILALLADELPLYDVGPGLAGGARILRLSAAVALVERQSEGQALYALAIPRAPAEPDFQPAAEEMAETLATNLLRLKIVERSVVQSFDWGLLLALRKAIPGLALAFQSSEQPDFDSVGRDAAVPSPWLGGLDLTAAEGSLPRLVAQAGGQVWSPDYRDLRPVDLKEAHDLGLRVVVWTVNDPATMASLLDLGVDGIVTDYPERLRAVLEERQFALPAPYPVKTP